MLQKLSNSKRSSALLGCEAFTWRLRVDMYRVFRTFSTQWSIVSPRKRTTGGHTGQFALLPPWSAVQCQDAPSLGCKPQLQDAKILKDHQLTKPRTLSLKCKTSKNCRPSKPCRYTFSSDPASATFYQRDQTLYKRHVTPSQNLAQPQKHFAKGIAALHDA